MSISTPRCLSLPNDRSVTSRHPSTFRNRKDLQNSPNILENLKIVNTWNQNKRTEIKGTYSTPLSVTRLHLDMSNSSSCRQLWLILRNVSSLTEAKDARDKEVILRK